MIIYGLKTCDTTRAAIKALTAAGKSPEFRDLRDDPPDGAWIERMLERLGDGLLNKASTTWRGLPQDEREAPVATLLARHPTLVKRPVIESGDAVTLGWSAPVRDRWLG